MSADPAQQAAPEPPAGRAPSLFAELRRRRVFKAGAAYLVIAWLVVQVASIALPAFEAPPWALRTFILLALLGFPAVLVLAWVLDWTPDGLRIDADARGTKRLFAIAGLLVVLAVGWYVMGLAALREADVAAPAARPAAPGVVDATALPVDAQSIAVLAFADLSPARDQGWFADGIAEEILNALAQVEGLKVAGRTSSFHYKDKSATLRAIGRELGVAHVLEGSVRMQGERVRVTAQLVRVADDMHLWSRRFDGELSDVFQLQEDIARAITSQLEVVLHGEAAARLVNVGTHDAGAYTRYLRASEIYHRRDYPRFPEALGLLQDSLAADPRFARARARIAMLHVIVGGGWVDGRLGDAGVVPNAEAAIALDPTLAEPHAALAMLARKQRRFLDAREAMDRALALEPADAATNLYDAQLLIVTGYTRQGIARLDRTLALDPLYANALNWRAMQHARGGDPAAGEALVLRARELGLSFADVTLAEVARAQGDPAKAIALMTSYLRGHPMTACLDAPETQLPVLLDAIYRPVPSEPGLARRAIDACIASRKAQPPPWIARALIAIGEPERALDLLARRALDDDASVFIHLWSPQGTEARKVPGFPQFVRDVGLAPLWDRLGPPDGCRKDPAGDYRCE